MLALDHLGYAVRDLDGAAVRFREELGLDSVVGGRHVGFGTANRIVPLGDQYIEIVGVVDEAEAEGSASPSPTTGGRAGGIATGAGIVVLALIVGGLLVMRSRLLRR